MRKKYSVTDIDECKSGAADCHANATCRNLFGTFCCDCAEGDGLSSLEMGFKNFSHLYHEKIILANVVFQDTLVMAFRLEKAVWTLMSVTAQLCPTAVAQKPSASMLSPTSPVNANLALLEMVTSVKVYSTAILALLFKCDISVAHILCKICKCFSFQTLMSASLVQLTAIPMQLAGTSLAHSAVIVQKVMVLPSWNCA